MARLEHFESGQLHVCGHALEDPNVDLKALRRDVRIVFPGYNLFPHLTVEQNVTIAWRIVKATSKDEAKTMAVDVLTKVGLKHKATAWPEQLSGGQQQRVAMARVVCSTRNL